MLRLGWFSTGTGEGSIGLLNTITRAMTHGELDARISFVFCNREPGEHPGSDKFMRLVKEYDLPLITRSSNRFRQARQAKSFSEVRTAFDRELILSLKSYQIDLCVLAGYMLILSPLLCEQWPTLNLHPALPSGPSGSWQQVIWTLIQTGASESGAMVHLVTEEPDQGPPLTYCSFPLNGKIFDPLWLQVDGKDLSGLQQKEGEQLPLFVRIRQEGLRREQPLLVETLKAVSSQRIRVSDGKVLDIGGNKFAPLDLSPEIDSSLGTAK